MMTTKKWVAEQYGIRSIFIGKYFKAWLVDGEALDVVMTDAQEGGTFSRSETRDMINELQTILEQDERFRHNQRGVKHVTRTI